MANGGKQRVAIIGGGVGAITTAYAIASDPLLRAKFDVTVYQLGWRLGGKGASGRDLENGGRILEHGLHVWAGFYENAFRLLRDCYERLVALGLRQPDAPLGTIGAAFKPLSHLLMAEYLPDGPAPSWRPWLIDLPSNELVPGTATSVAGPFDMFRRMLEIAIAFLEDGELGVDAPSVAAVRDAHAAVHRHASTMPDKPAAHDPAQVVMLQSLVLAAQSVGREHLDAGTTHSDARRRMLLLADCCMAVAHGLIAGGVFEKGYDTLDDVEFTEWLRQNGAHETTLKSTLLRSCYDFVFGYPHGRGLAGDVGAGTAVRAMSRLTLSYRGAIFWKMQAGMGDTVFAPYYQVLSALGVKFRFFNAARSLRLNADRTRIAAVDMVEQAATLGEYRPLVDVVDLPCWPSQPDWDQLVDGAKLKASGIDFECEAKPPAGRHYTLEAGRDFDTLVLGASMGSLPYLTEELSAASPRWRRMIGAVKTVGTQAAQFWLTKPQDALGWRALVEHDDPGVKLPDGPLQTVITGFAEPLDTWADMSHLLDREDWGPDGPASIAYFCSPAPDGTRLDDFKAATRQWASEDLTQLWPDAAAPGHGGFQADDLYARSGTVGDPFDAQYYRVNMHGSERYVLSLTGSLYHRLAPDDSGFANLVLAGDWTRCGLNAGCVEAATMSGIAAAVAVTGTTMLNIGAEDIAPDDTVEGRALYSTSSISGAPWPITSFYARGEMSGWFVFAMLPRDQVQSLLPRHMSLARAPFANHGMHPVGLSFCRYHAVRGSFLPDFLSMPPYGEATFAIPFVHAAEAGPAVFLYPRKLYVDSLPAIAAGRLFYAMNKSRARITQNDRSFRAYETSGRSFIDATFMQHDDPSPLANHPAFGTVSALLNLPFVTTGPFGLLYNAFNLELDHAFAAPVSGEIAVTDRQPGGFPPMTFSARPLVPNHPHHLPGALRIWCNWSMTNPIDVRRVKQTAMEQAWLKRTYAGPR
jgi:uncharacterized protein with NAD-binding domain and iron-sulfur cluster